MTAPPDPLPSSEYMADQDGERLDQFLCRRMPGLSRAAARRLLDGGLVRVDGDLERPSHRLSFGAMVRVWPPGPAEPVAEAQAIPLDIRYEDADVIVVNKPVGLTVHPTPGHSDGTLVNALLAHCPDLQAIGDAIRPGIVQRLDKDTSGVMVVAKHEAALHGLQDQIRARQVEKRYFALVAGWPDPTAGTIDAPIGRDPADRRRMAIVDQGRPSRTEYDRLETLDVAALLDCRLITGRTHQIRVHLAALGHPIIGDPVYGSRSNLIDRQALHAYLLGFVHPISGAAVRIAVPPPPDFRDALAGLRRRGPGAALVATVDPEPGRSRWRSSRHRAKRIR